MALFGKTFNEGEKVTEKPCDQEEMEKVSELLTKKKEFLKTKIDQELLYVKKHGRKNRTVALQALRRKRWYEKRLRYIDCAVKTLRSAQEHIDILNKMSDLIKAITEEQDGIEDMSDSVHTSMCFRVEFDEDELQVELERLEKNLDETEQSIPCPKDSSTATLSHPAKTEEEEIEEELEYLRRWLD